MPAGSFVLAIVLTLLGHTPTRLLARPAAGLTGECRHEGKTEPGLAGTVETKDGNLSPLRPPLIADFSPAAQAQIFQKHQLVAKDQDGSVCVKVALPGKRPRELNFGDKLETRGDPQKAAIDWRLVDGGFDKCCHGISIQATGLFRGDLLVDEAHWGTTVRASIGDPKSGRPVEYTTYSFYDQNCNGRTDSREEIISVLADVNIDRVNGRGPATYTIIGFVESITTEIVDNHGVQTPVRIPLFQQGKTRHKGFRRILERQYGFNLGKAFEYASRTEMRVKDMNVQIEHTREDQVFPMAAGQAGVSFYTTKLANTDTNEHKFLEIPKTAK